MPTNEKIVYEFVSDTKAYVSLSFTEDASEGTGTPWTDRQEADVDIVGNDVTLIQNPEPGKTVVADFHVNAITGTTMIWGAIRQDEYGQRYPPSFALTRIEYWEE